MNIYLVETTWLKPETIKIFINIFKVKVLYNFDNTPLNLTFEDISGDTIKILKRERRDMYMFLNMCAKDFVGEIISNEFKGNGEVFIDSTSVNPLYNLERCDDPNILVLHNSHDKNGKLTNHNARIFVEKVIDLLCKVRKEDYIQRICFYGFDQFLSLSNFLIPKKKDGTYYIKQISALFHVQGEDCRLIEDFVDEEQCAKFREEFEPILNEDRSLYAIRVKYIDDFDPLLSFLYVKSNNEVEGNSVQERFLLPDAIKIFENNVIKAYKEYTNEMDEAKIRALDNSWAEDANNWGQKKEMEYILNNGGDWIYD